MNRTQSDQVSTQFNKPYNTEKDSVQSIKKNTILITYNYITIFYVIFDIVIQKN